MKDPKKKTIAFVAEIDEAELAVRLMERASEMRRSASALETPAREHLVEAMKNWPPEAGRFPFGDMARIAIEYFRECIEKGQRPA